MHCMQTRAANKQHRAHPVPPSSCLVTVNCFVHLKVGITVNKQQHSRTCCASCCQLLLLQRPDLVLVVAALHSMGLAVSMLAVVLMSPAFIGAIRRSMLSTLEGMREVGQGGGGAGGAASGRIAVVERKFRLLQYNVVGGIGFQFVVAFGFGFWPCTFFAPLRCASRR